jgi:hypothetical protein
MKPSEPSYDLLIRLLTDWAWPIVALIVFANLRGELKELLGRIANSLSKISLPGGIALDLQNIEQVTENKKINLLSITPRAEETAKDLRTLEVAKAGTYQESCPLGVLELCTFKQLTSICALGSS